MGSSKALVYRTVKIGTLTLRGLAFGRALAGAAAVPAEPATFVDPDLFMHLPTRKLGPGPVGEDGIKTLIEALDVEALLAMPAIGEEQMQAAKQRFRAALGAEGLEPEEEEIRLRTGQFEMFDHAGEVIARPVNIRAWFERTLDGKPREGPGAKITATFDPWLNVTHYRFAWREVEPTERKVPVLPEKAAEDRFLELYRRSLPGLESFDPEIRLVYYLPAVEQAAVELILPHYLCGGTARLGDGTIDLLEMLMPAVDSREYVPEARLSARLKGGEIEARVEVEGGQPPYSFRWSPIRPELEPTASSLRYRIEEVQESETVAVTVIDANGISTVAERTLAVPPPTGGVSAPLAAPPAYAFGTENAVTETLGALEAGLVERFFEYHGGKPRTGFSWSGNGARQRHFKPPGDRRWVDNADLVFFAGHGYGGGIALQFRDKHADECDYKLYHHEVVKSWGDQRLEWLALYACNALKSRQWRHAFDGLHLLLGFATKAKADVDFSGGFARHLLTRRLSVASAWFAAVADHQRDGDVGAVMGAVRQGDFACNYNDRYHGIGPVGPDIPADEIRYFFRITGP